MLRQVTLELNLENEIQRVAREAGVQMRVADCRDVDDQTMAMLLELEGERGSLRTAVQGLRRSKQVKQMHETEVRENKSLMLTILEQPPLCNASMGLGVVCLACPYGNDGENMTWKVLVRSSGDVRSLISRLEKKGVKTRVVGISEVDHEDLLTDRQKEVVATALSLGYFDFPRKVGLTELSKRVGVKPSSLSEILRSAERKIMESATRDVRAPIGRRAHTGLRKPSFD